MMRFKNLIKNKIIFSNLISQILSFFLIILFIPILTIIFILIYWIDGRPIFYLSVRSGYLGRPFKLLKFRTMQDNDLDDKYRITKLGKFLRRSSLDELPQLINIFRGDMVFVGPRPLPFSITNTGKLKKYFSKRSSVKPGLTGLSQVFSKGKPRKYYEKLVYDLLYIKKKSMFFDLIIILLTFSALRKRFVFNKSGGTL